ncbi:MAG: CHAP domain-containing protein [Methanobrevibacter sp.]|nr:CHAP domain-containing protein [Methanobrevibacter sp.]
MKLSEFINKWNGKPCDYDGAFGAQCVDLFRMYSKEVLSIKEHTGSVDGARELYTNYEKLPLEKKYFSRIARCKSVKAGDVAVWDKSDTNKYGHVAIVISKLEDYLLVFEQNGFKQDGAKIVLRTYDNYLGVLRFKAGK